MNQFSGGPQYVTRWSTLQAIKETFVPLREIDYPYMREQIDKSLTIQRLE